MAQHHEDPAVSRNRLVIIAVTTTMCVIGTMAISLRIFSRWFLLRNPGRDDWCMAIAWFIGLGYYAALMVDWTLGLGDRSSNIPLNNLIAILKSTLAIEITYFISVFFIKTSILLLYLRFATQKLFRTFCRVSILVLFVYTIICVIIILLQCRPIAKLWDLAGTISATCIDANVFLIITASLNLASDIWVTVLPIPTLAKIQRPMREKITLVLIFAVGIFSCVAAAMRLQATVHYSRSIDISFDTVSLDIWSSIEVNIAILCSSMPSLKPLLCFWSRSEQARRKGHSSTSRGYVRSQYGETGSGNNGRNQDRDPDSFVMTSGLKRESTGNVLNVVECGSDTGSTDHIIGKGSQV